MARRGTSPAVDEVPQNAVDMGQAPVNPADLTKQASTGVSIFSTLPQWEPHPTLVELARMREEHVALLAANDVATPEGYKVVKQALRALTPLRTAVDNRRLEEGRQARDYVKRVNEAGNTIIERIKEIETPLEKALEAEDQRKYQEALEKAQAIEKEQREKEEQRLALIAAEEKRKKDAEEAERKRQQEELDKQRAELDRQRKELEDQQRAQKEEADRLRAENERLQRETQARIDAENKRLADAKQAEERRQEAEKQALEAQEREKERVAQAERDRLATEARVKKEREEAAARAVEAERKRVADAEAARLAKEEKDRKAAEKKAAQAPDKAKVNAWWTKLIDVINTAPTCKDPEAIQVVGRAKKDLIAVNGILKLFVEAK